MHHIKTNISVGFLLIVRQYCFVLYRKSREKGNARHFCWGFSSNVVQFSTVDKRAQFLFLTFYLPSFALQLSHLIFFFLADFILPLSYSTCYCCVFTCILVIAERNLSIFCFIHMFLFASHLTKGIVEKLFPLPIAK